MREDTKKSRLLKDPNVKRWYHNLAAGSMHTADVAVRRLTRFCELGKVAHDTLLSLPQKELEDLAQDVVRECERVGYAPDYTMGLVRGLRSWLRHNERELKRDIKIKDLGVPVTLAEETVPEPFQLQEVLSAATTRGKVTASFMAFSGLRPEVLGNKDGTLGLVLGDLPDLDLEKLEFRSIPAQVVVRRELSKVRHQYFTFLNAKGCEYLLAYLRWRAREIRHDKTKKLIKPAEKLTPNSPVIRADEDHKKAMLEHQRLKGLEITPTDFLATTKIAKEVRRAIKRAGHKLRPYVLRSFFDSHLLNAELQGRMTSTARQFFMGHKGDIERKYTLNKHRLPQQLAEDMKRQYEQGATFLDPEQLTAKQVEEKVELVRADLRARVEEEHKSELAQLKAQVSELSGLKEKVDILMALTRIYPAKLEELAKPSPDAETGLTELKELGLLAES